LAIRGWAKEHGLPRFVFIKVPDEPKPLYVDLESPIYIDIMVRTIRRSENKQSLLRFTEMIPNLDQLWLTDATGRHYTSELRLVALDMATW
jgi:hypothetical protein